MINIQETGFDGLFILIPSIHEDERGYFMESFNLDQFYRKTGIKISFVQDNEAKSNQGVLRGLHYQLQPCAQSKLVRVIKGRVLDVVLDIRPGSRTYGKHFTVELNEDNKWQLFVPKGFAHGYKVLEDDTIFSYKCDAFYQPQLEYGIRFNDPKLGIDWDYGNEVPIVSEKDNSLPEFVDHIAFK